jgi:uncharacterized membrane protein YidH (DUF202 family)
MTTLALAAGQIFQHVVAPTLFVFLLLLALLVMAAKTWPWERTSAPDARHQRPPLTRLLRHLAITALAGYAIFLAIVAVFHVIIGGGSVSVIGDATSGGAFLAFVVAVPVLFGLGTLTKRR